MITVSPQLTREQYAWLDKAINEMPNELRDNNRCEPNIYDLDGKLYVVFYRRDLSNFDYTKYKVYDVLTQEEKWGRCMKGIAECLEDTSISIGEYKALNDANPSFANYLRRHHKMENIENTEVMRYTIITPYDD